MLLAVTLLLAACQPATVATPTPTEAVPTAAAPAPTATMPPIATVAEGPASPTMAPPSPSATARPASTTAPTASPATATPPPVSPTTQAQPEGTPVAERVTLVLDGGAGAQVEVQAELAIDREQRSLGLMHRETLAEGTGMLFVFPGDTETGFWMANTKVPLSIAFIDADGAIVGLDDMQPLSTEIHPPPGPYRYALEVPQGFFARQGVEAGAIVRYRDGATLRPLSELPATSSATR